MLTAHQIGCQFDDVWLWRDLSFEVAAGQAVGVAGRSGTGKSLLLRTLVGLQPLQTGEILFQEKPLHHWPLPELRCRAMYLHQNPVSLADTVEADLQAALTLKRHQALKYSRDTIVHWLDHIDKPPTFLHQASIDLSGGERQIVALLRAFQLNPKLLLLDEPTTALDAMSTAQIEAMLQSWLKKDLNRAYLLVSHDSEQRQRLTTRTIQWEKP